MLLCGFLPGIKNPHADRIALINNRRKAAERLALLDKLVVFRQIVKRPANTASEIQFIGGDLVKTVARFCRMGKLEFFQIAPLIQQFAVFVNNAEIHF